MCHSPIPTKTHNKSDLIIFLCASEAVWPVGHERKSPVGKAPKVGVQIPVLANFFTACLQFDWKQNTRSSGGWQH